MFIPPESYMHRMTTKNEHIILRYLMMFGENMIDSPVIGS